MIENSSLEILYADNSCVVINKPAGLLSIPDGYNPKAPHLAAILERGFGKVWIVHRLDRETSGLMIVARTSFAHREFNLQFEHRQIQKIYHALITGFPDWESVEVDTPLKINGDRRHRTVPSPFDGKKARTTFTIITRYAKGCLIEARPHTGYTHQIRAHLASMGFPIFGDVLYRNRQESKIISESPILQNSRTFLHATSISFEHPLTRKKYTFFATYPEDFLAAVKLLN